MTTDADSLPDATDSSPETPSEISFPQELLEAIPADKKDEFRQKYGRLFLEVRKEQHYSGPLQPSREASAWNELVDGSAERSFNLYERQEIQRIEASDRILAITEKKFQFDCEMEQKRHDDSVDIAKSNIKINTDIVKRG